MKRCAIYDKDLDRQMPIGYLFYYEKAESFVIELCEDMDKWEAPILFQGLVEQGIYTIPTEISLMWVRERIIPSGRQNIGMILKNHNLKEYSEWAMLFLSKGYCSQDACYIKEITDEDVPESIRNRLNKNVLECFWAEDDYLICLFKDDTVRRIDFTDIAIKYCELFHVLNNEKLKESIKVDVGGYGISFNDSIKISTLVLRSNGTQLPLTARDFLRFTTQNVVDTGTACDMLQCSRQNLHYLVKERKLVPLFCGTKENMYLKADIERLRSE